MHLRVLAFVTTACGIAFAPAVGFAQTEGTTTTTAAPAPSSTPSKSEPASAPASAPADKNKDKQAVAVELKQEESKEPEKAEEEGEPKRAVYLSFDIGFTRADVGGFSNDLAFDKTGANGVLYGIGAGYRSRELRVGARFRGYDTTEYTLWAPMLEVGYGLKYRPLSPIFVAHVGYAFDTTVQRGAIASSLPAGNVLTPNVALQGLVLGGEITGSYWLTEFLRLGPFVGFDMFFLSRDQVNQPQSVFPSGAPSTHPLYTTSGSGVGYAISLGLRVTTDIGF